MTELSAEEVAELRWGDADYLGHYWAADTDRPTLVIRLVPAASAPVELVADWANSLKVDLDYRNCVGPLLTWDVAFERLGNGEWDVQFDFADHGGLSFRCNHLALRTIITNPAG